MDAIPDAVLTSHDSEVICKVMRYFVLEVRREDGARYNASTIRSLLCGLNRGIKENGAPFSMLDKNNPAFRQLHLILDSLTSGLHRDGIGAKRNSACVISLNDEALFWQRGLLGTSDPKVLQITVFLCWIAFFVTWCG